MITEVNLEHPACPVMTREVTLELPARFVMAPEVNLYLTVLCVPASPDQSWWFPVPADLP